MILPDANDVFVCKECGGRLFSETLIYSYKKHPKLKDTWTRVPMKIEVVCRECKHTAMDIPYEKIHDVIKPRT